MVFFHFLACSSFIFVLSFFLQYLKSTKLPLNVLVVYLMGFLFTYCLLHSTDISDEYIIPILKLEVKTIKIGYN